MSNKIIAKLESAVRLNPVAFFCLCDVLLFIGAAYLVISSLHTDIRAVNLGGYPLPTDQWTRTQMAFVTSLVLDFISWLWTVHKDKTNLFYLAFVINGIPVLTYTLMSTGIAPVLLDAHGNHQAGPFFCHDHVVIFDIRNVHHLSGIYLDTASSRPHGM
jgi:hypothetical protein